MPHGTDEMHAKELQKQPQNHRNPNPQRKRNPRPGHKKDPDPIINPEIWPPEDWKFPQMTKKDETNQHEEDYSRKAGFNYADWRETRPHTLEEHLVCGYEKNGKKISQLILGNESQNGAIQYIGHVPIDDYPLDALVIASHPKTDTHPFSAVPFMSDKPAVWIEPGLNCIVECSEKTENGLMVAPVYRGLRAENPLRLAPVPTSAIQ